MEDIKKINQNIKILLLKYPELRSPFKRKQAHIKYWQEFDELGKFGISLKEYVRLTSAETISRAIRKCQEENPELRPTSEIQEKIAQKVENFRLVYKKQ